jgi:hypothetical protein
LGTSLGQMVGYQVRMRACMCVCVYVCVRACVCDYHQHSRFCGCCNAIQAKSGYQVCVCVYVCVHVYVGVSVYLGVFIWESKVLGCCSTQLEAMFNLSIYCINGAAHLARACSTSSTIRQCVGMQIHVLQVLYDKHTCEHVTRKFTRKSVQNTVHFYHNLAHTPTLSHTHTHADKHVLQVHDTSTI